MIAHKRTLFLLVALVSLINVVLGMTIDVFPKEEECFYEDLAIDDQFTITYQVIEGGNHMVDFTIAEPNGNIISRGGNNEKGAHMFKAKVAGRYTYCFSNKLDGDSAKAVSFNEHINESAAADANGDGAVDPLEKEIRELADSILGIKAEQEYIVARERRHRDTAESTNSRVKWWSVIQLVLLFAVCFWQVYYLKRFFEVKRVV
ncbi:COPII-coated vesicle protein [Backusella circina FSU 941]|nr:COPII-coated vesicle protein [Backusella circina FSU 941]